MSTDVYFHALPDTSERVVTAYRLSQLSWDAWHLEWELDNSRGQDVVPDHGLSNRMHRDFVHVVDGADHERCLRKLSAFHDRFPFTLITDDLIAWVLPLIPQDEHERVRAWLEKHRGDRLIVRVD